MSVTKMIRIGILAGMAFVIMLFEFPLPLFPDFLQYDGSEIPALLGTFAMGPWVGVLIQLVKNLFYLLFSGRGNPVGVMGNFLSGGTMVFIAGQVYERFKNKKGALWALGAGSMAMGLVMLPLNTYILFPLYGVQLTPGQVAPMMLGLVLPFNLLKGILTSTVTFLLYKRVRGFLHGDLHLSPLDSEEGRTS